MRSNEEATMSLVNQRPDRGKRATNSQHVESVLARIFSRRREYGTQRLFRSFDPEDFEADPS